MDGHPSPVLFDGDFAARVTPYTPTGGDLAASQQRGHKSMGEMPWEEAKNPKGSAVSDGISFNAAISE
eukprot:6217425-Karenia_brevis.AAC.1